jgi:outer membrane receptor for ferrienterochelin and colicin
MKLQTNRISGNLIVFRNHMKDLITPVKSTYNGKDSIDGVRVYQRQNLDQAVIQGFEAGVNWAVLPPLTLFGNISYTHGKDLKTDAPLRRIPPVNSRLGVRYLGENQIHTMVEWAHAGEQTRLSQGDIDDSRIQDGGTPSWNVVNCSLGYTGGFFEVNAGIQNLFNEAYRMHGSGIDGRGRSFWISLKLFQMWPLN